MDFIKGLWGGNVFPKFESNRRDVDQLEGKDVQVVGVSFKRLYSSVVEDILPLCGNTEKLREQQSGDSGQFHLVENDSSTNQGCTDTLRNSDPSEPLKGGYLIPFDMPSCEDPSQEQNNISNLGAGDDASIFDREENNERDTVPAIINSNSNNDLFLTLPDDDHINSSSAAVPSLALTAYKEDQLTTRPLRFTFPADGDCLSSVSGSGWLSEGELVMREHPNSDEAGILYFPMEAPVDEFNTDIVKFMESPIHCSHEALANDELPSNDSSTKSESSGISRSFKSPEIVSTYFSKSVEFATMTEAICNVKSEGSACSISTRSSTTATYETKQAETFPAIPILESSVCSSGSSYERYNTDGQTTAAISPPRTGEIREVSVRRSDLSMDTVYFSAPNVQPDAKMVVWNHNFVLATSHTRKDFTYYKDLLKDRFTSRKRLSKEYKLLPILYGDIDMEASWNFERSSVLDSLALETSRTSEAEWELL